MEDCVDKRSMGACSGGLITPEGVEVRPVRQPHKILRTFFGFGEGGERSLDHRDTFGLAVFPPPHPAMTFLVSTLLKGQHQKCHTM